MGNEIIILLIMDDEVDQGTGSGTKVRSPLIGRSGSLHPWMCLLCWHSTVQLMQVLVCSSIIMIIIIIIFFFNNNSFH